MKAIIICLLAVILAGCSAPAHMIKATYCPDICGIKPLPGKSSLVIADTSIFETYDRVDNPDIGNYLDTKFIGTLKSNSFLVTAVEPGDHYVIADGENLDTIFLNFEPDKTYYLTIERRMGISLTRTKYSQVKADRIYNDMKGKCLYFEVDPSKPGNPLDEDKFEKIVDNYKRKGTSRAL